MTIQKMAFTTEETAEMLSIGTDKVDDLRNSGALRAIKRGKGYIFPIFEIETFLKDYIGQDISNRTMIQVSVANVRAKKEAVTRSKRLTA